jgi:hypothetical protein
VIYNVSRYKGGSSMKFSRELGMHYDTVWNQVHKIRNAMRAPDEHISLGGFIELDQAVFGPESRKVAGPVQEGEVRQRKSA